MDKKELGYYGENVVAYYLKKKGYTILKRNFCVKGGEIDIIAQYEDIIAFVEVKTRAPDPLVNGFEAVTKSKKKLIRWRKRELKSKTLKEILDYGRY